jgi:hypothetical protein
MRLIHVTLACLALVASPIVSMAAGAAASVRAIAFVASHTPGTTDPQLAPYQPILSANLRFESFHYVGESSASVSGGGTSTVSLPNGMQIQVTGGAGGSVTVKRGGTVVTVSPGRPAVFMGGPAGAGNVSGIIVMVN